MVRGKVLPSCDSDELGLEDACVVLKTKLHHGMDVLVVEEGMLSEGKEVVALCWI